jgi:hypothetical protein
MKAGIWTKPQCDEHATHPDLSGTEIVLSAKLGPLARYPKGVLICHTLAVTKDECIWGYGPSADLTDYSMGERLRQDWSPGPRCEGVAPQE